MAINGAKNLEVMMKTFRKLVELKRVYHVSQDKLNIVYFLLLENNWSHVTFHAYLSESRLRT